jgi:hypothetical protein
VGANAVVTRDVPEGHVAIGIPAACKPVPQVYVDGYFDPANPLRQLGMLAEHPRPPAALSPARRRLTLAQRGKKVSCHSAVVCGWLLEMPWLAPLCAL